MNVEIERQLLLEEDAEIGLDELHAEWREEEELAEQEFNSWWEAWKDGLEYLSKAERSSHSSM